eukprot:Sspe_Gene.117022::Locus_107316_Transcript_1_1_Confidence_1.000_Length_395::g.117022::m.117022
MAQDYSLQLLPPPDLNDPVVWGDWVDDPRYHSAAKPVDDGSVLSGNSIFDTLSTRAVRAGSKKKRLRPGVSHGSVPTCEYDGKPLGSHWLKELSQPYPRGQWMSNK